MSGFKWLDKEFLEKKQMETISDKEYSYFITTMERLVQLPYSYRIKDFILSYSQSLMSQTKTMDIPKLQYDDQGRAFITTYGKIFSVFRVNLFINKFHYRMSTKTSSGSRND